MSRVPELNLTRLSDLQQYSPNKEDSVQGSVNSMAVLFVDPCPVMPRIFNDYILNAIQALHVRPQFYFLAQEHSHGGGTLVTHGNVTSPRGPPGSRYGSLIGLGVEEYKNA